MVYEPIDISSLVSMETTQREILDKVKFFKDNKQYKCEGPHDKDLAAIYLGYSYCIDSSQAWVRGDSSYKGD